jgi:phosphoribosylaminoimidazole-succinocarboxamide synthase
LSLIARLVYSPIMASSQKGWEMASSSAFLESSLPGLPVRRGKVRDVYELGDGRLLIVATDRISAFDWVLPTGIPDKGRVLTALSDFWFRKLGVRNHLQPNSGDLIDHGEFCTGTGIDISEDDWESLEGRMMLVRKMNVVPFECVVRGYLSGSGWKEYRSLGTVCGERLPPGLVESDRIVPPIFTPATKAESGHDENVPFQTMAEAVPLADRLRSMSLSLYQSAADHARSCGLILADTKFEWGLDTDGEPVLIDEALTPDSSRYWPLDQYRPGGPQPSFDKQFVRDWLETTGWDKASPPPALPDDVVAKTRAKYVEAYEILTSQPFRWK